MEIVRKVLRWESVSMMGSDGPMVDMVSNTFPFGVEKDWQI